MLDIRVGSTETLLVDVTDTLDNLTDLNDGSPHYDVLAHDGTAKITNQAAVVDSVKKMTAHCLVNTTGWTPGRYSLYLKFASSPDSPRLGPLEFKVNP